MSKFAKVSEQKFTQELHTSCFDRSKDAEFTLSAVSNGVADFLTLHAYELAFSDHDEIDEFAKMLHTFMDDNCETYHD